MPLQNLSDRAAGHFVPQMGQGTLGAPIAPSRFSSAIRVTKASITPIVRGHPGSRWPLPSCL
jgi:hypothetical protein